MVMDDDLMGQCKKCNEGMVTGVRDKYFRAIMVSPGSLSSSNVDDELTMKVDYGPKDQEQILD